MKHDLDSFLCILSYFRLEFNSEATAEDGMTSAAVMARAVSVAPRQTIRDRPANELSLLCSHR